jgi:hypothetical protein
VLARSYKTQPTTAREDTGLCEAGGFEDTHAHHSRLPPVCEDVRCEMAGALHAAPTTRP